MDKAKKTETIEKHKISEKDCGSVQVQIALLTGRINHLAGHLKTHPADQHGRRGLLLMVGHRKRLISYLTRKDKKGCAELLKSLGLK